MIFDPTILLRTTGSDRRIFGQPVAEHPANAEYPLLTTIGRNRPRSRRRNSDNIVSREVPVARCLGPLVEVSAMDQIDTVVVSASSVLKALKGNEVALDKAAGQRAR